MTDFGGRLRQARERRGVSLRQIAASTKIPVAALEALERNDTSRLPGGIFSRAFVRSYALEVGLDPDETVREFLARFHAEQVAPGPSAAAPGTPARVRPAATPAPDMHEAESTFESHQRMANVLLKIVVVSAALAGLILYFTLRSRPSAAARSEPRPIASPDPAALRPGGPPATAPVRASNTAVERAAVPRPPVTTGAAARARPSEEPLTLELHPTGPCWVSLTVDGKRIMSRVMDAGEKATYRVGSDAVVEVGDAGAFAFSINGRAARPLGELGEAGTARISRETLAHYIR